MTQFRKLCELCEALSKVSSRNLKINLVANFLSKVSLEEEVTTVILLILGKLPKAYWRIPLNISYSTVYQIVTKMAKVEEKRFFDEFNQTGDIGETVRRILEKHPPRPKVF